MNFKLVPLKRFQKDVKSLKKRFPKIKNDLEKLTKELLEGQTNSISLGNNFYKLRVSNSSVPTGKSGGFRIITYYQIDEAIYLITIYSKSDKDSISTKALQNIIKDENL